MTNRLLGKFIGGGRNDRVKHYIGLPPELTHGRDDRIEMKPAAFLIIDERPEDVFLYRYGTDGSYAGDTWHMTIEEAKGQAAFEFAGVSVEWEVVPPGVEDVIAFGLAHVQG